MSALILKQGRVIDPLSAVDHVLDVRISSGSVLELAPSLQARSERVLDLAGMWVVPGLVDLRCVLRDDADVEGALMGGLTAVMLTPESPRTGSVRLFVAYARALTRDLKGDELGEVADGAKVLSNGFVPLQKAGVLRRALQYASPLKKLVMVHPDDPTISARGLLGEGPTATRLGLLGVPSAAETSVVARDLEVLESTGGRLHFSHLTCARSVALVRDAKARGLEVSCDVTAHHVTLDDTAAEDFALLARVWPPLRSAADVAGLRAGLADGTIDAISSDHQRVEPLDLEHPFEQSTPGIDAFKGFVKRALSLGLTPKRFVEVTAVNPARLMGLAARKISKDEVADITVIDPEKMAVHATIVGGELRYFEGRTQP